MNKTILLLMIQVGVLFSQSRGQDDRRRQEQIRQQKLNEVHQQLKTYREQLEDLKAKRWQDKRNSIAAQDAFQQTWNDLKQQVDRLHQQKLHKEELLLRLETQKEEKQQQVDELKSRHDTFASVLKEKISESKDLVENGFPHLLTKNLDKINHLQQLSQENENNLVPVISDLFDFHESYYQMGESSGMQRMKMLTEGSIRIREDFPEIDVPRDVNAALRAGHAFRFGTIYKAFVSSEDESVALLVKTGRIGPQAWQWTEDVPRETRDQIRIAGQKALSQDTGIVMFPMDVLLTNAMGEGYSSTAKINLFAGILKEFKAGGFAMYPIIIVLIIGLLICLERAIYFFRKSLGGRSMSQKVLEAISLGKHSDAEKISGKGGGVYGELIRAFFKGNSKNKEEAESMAYETLLRETPHLEKRLGTINVLAAAAPLLGLLGTVSGMIHLFEAITTYGTDDPKMMASGISEAMVTTKWGLIVAVPLLLLYNWLNSWSARIQSDLERYSAELSNALYLTSPDGPYQEDEITEESVVSENVESSGVN